MQGKVAILIDDGLATGSTMRAAVLALRQKEPARIIVAVPVGARLDLRRVSVDCRRLRLCGRPGKLPCRRAVVRRLCPDDGR